MTTYPKFSSASMLCMALAICLFPVAAFPQDGGTEPSATEILAESKAAMNQSLKYRHIMGGNEMVVYQKLLPDGSMATLTEISALKQINISYGDKNYQLYLDQRVAIDMQFMYQGAKAKAASMASTLGDRIAESSRLVGTVQRDGKECYEIETTLTADALATLAESLPPEAMRTMPAKRRCVIDKATYLMVERETISPDGSSISSVEYRDIKPQPDLSDDFFQLPAGFETKEPRTMEEYTALVGEMLRPETSAKALQEPQRGLPLFPPNEQEYTVPARIQEKIDANRQSRMRKPAGKIEAESFSTVRKSMLVVSTAALIVVLAATFAGVRRKNSK